MTLQEKIIAIAELHGCRRNKITLHWLVPGGNPAAASNWKRVDELPNYFGDLDAMHAVEMSLNDVDYEVYWNELVTVCAIEKFTRMNSTPASMRAEALRIAMQLW